MPVENFNGHYANFNLATWEIFRTLLGSGWQPYRAGSTRAVLTKGRECLKLPIWVADIKHNLNEDRFCRGDWAALADDNAFKSMGFQIVKAYHEFKGVPLPLNPYKIQLLRGMPLLRGELLNTKERLPLPWWELYADSYQAGRSAKGEALLYDYNFWIASRSTWMLQQAILNDYTWDDARRVFDGIVSLVPWSVAGWEKPEWK